MLAYFIETIHDGCNVPNRRFQRDFTQIVRSSQEFSSGRNRENHFGKEACSAFKREITRKSRGKSCDEAIANTEMEEIPEEIAILIVPLKTHRVTMDATLDLRTTSTSDLSLSILSGPNDDYGPGKIQVMLR